MPTPPILVFNFDSRQCRFGKSAVCSYLCDYLDDIKAKTCVYEKDYIDKDYLIDYSKFYARSFQDHGRKTERFHFFSNNFTEEQFKTALASGDKKFITSLQKKYLGFIVIKPIIDRRGHKLVGRTVLGTYPEHDNGDVRKFIKNDYTVSLFGIPLKVEGLPYQQKDEGVGLCATITCWSSLFPLMNLFGIQTSSPFEITERSTTFPDDSRNFPPEGLTLQQMKTYFSSEGLETEFIDPKIEDPTITEKDDIVADVIKAYNHLGLPVIATLNVKKQDVITDFHAILISGYRHKNWDVKELYIHDDNIGPYHHIMQTEERKHNSRFSQWSETDSAGAQVDYELDRLIVPVYPKIRLCFTGIYRVLLRYRRGTDTLVAARNLPQGSRTELFLTNIRSYKEYLFNQGKIENKDTKLLHPMPRFMWIIRIHIEDMPIFDYCFDATNVYPTPFTDIDFGNR
jgi:hypothetical protein